MWSLTQLIAYHASETAAVTHSVADFLPSSICFLLLLRWAMIPASMANLRAWSVILEPIVLYYAITLSYCLSRTVNASPTMLRPMNEFAICSLACLSLCFASHSAAPVQLSLSLFTILHRAGHRRAFTTSQQSLLESSSSHASRCCSVRRKKASYCWCSLQDRFSEGIKQDLRFIKSCWEADTVRD